MNLGDSVNSSSGNMALEERQSETNFASKEKYEVSSCDVETQPVGATSDDFPDGGFRAWLIVAGAMCSTFSTFGYVNSWGIFQSYYEETILRTSSPSTVAWIGSIQYSLVFFPALLVGRLFDLGYFHSIFFTASSIIVIATFLIAQCTQYWHFLLCQGILVGAGCGGLYGPTSSVIAHWFKKRRGFAMGIVTMGSSIGGTVLPITAQNLIPRVGYIFSLFSRCLFNSVRFPWTMRIFGFILLTTLGVANLLLRRRLPPKNVAGGLLNLSAFKSAAYSTFCASTLVVFLGIYTMLTYVAVSATEIGVSPNFAFYFIAIANASSTFGRYTAGILSDRIGPMNTQASFTVCAAIITYAWPFAQSKSSLIALTVLYGFCSGVYVSLVSNPIMDMGDTGDVGRRTGMFMTILAVGALSGPPISGAINTRTGSFKPVGYYAGTVVLFGVGLLALSRYFVIHRLWGKI